MTAPRWFRPSCAIHHSRGISQGTPGYWRRIADRSMSFALSPQVRSPSRNVAIDRAPTVPRASDTRDAIASIDTHITTCATPDPPGTTSFAGVVNTERKMTTRVRNPGPALSLLIPMDDYTAANSSTCSNFNRSSSTVIRTVRPGANRPLSNPSASGSSIRFWMMRRKGRAPYVLS